MYIDTHLHISTKYGDSPKQFVTEACKNHVKILIASACDRDSMEESISLMEQFSMLYYAIGFHPEEVLHVSDQDLDYLEVFIQSYSKVIAIGEIGLDYHYDSSHKEEQRKLFRKQLALAEKYHLPVVIHSRNAIQETYDVLKEYSLRGVIHCFSGSVEMAKRFVSLGYMLGIGGVLTFKNSRLWEVIQEIPLEFILLETDSPYLAPVPHRGEVNASKYIPLIAEKIASIKQITVEQVAKVTTENAKRMFDFSREL